jgi:prolyl-tRNA synthetase
MKWKSSHIYTLKETPADAEIPSHQLMVRGGYIKKVAQGIFTYGPLALKAIRKFEKIVREELDKRNCVEILMPMVNPRELWDETGRWTSMGKGLLKFQNRLGQDFCLGATHEECVTDFVRRDVKSYRDLPVNLYQVQTKYRDEIRPRFGLMRGREFIMKDAYSFDISQAEALKAYKLMDEAYKAIFSRIGAKYVSVKADSGAIGGDRSEEFHILADSGEDALLVSEDGTFAANVEVCPAVDANPVSGREAKSSSYEKFATPYAKTIEELSKLLKKMGETNYEPKDLVKTMFFSGADVAEGQAAVDIKPICVLLRGSDEVNPVKLKNLLGLSNPPLLLTEDEVFKLTGAHPGSCGPVGLKIPIYMDYGVEPLRDYVVGANEDGFHLKNVNHERDYKFTKLADLRQAREGDRNPNGSGLLKSYRGIEVGHIFYLGTKYSKAMNANFLNQEGVSMPIEMGCYGIGISRTVQAVIEQCHDKDGIIWPKALAPFQVHVCLLDPADPAAAQIANTLYENLTSEGVDVLIDDRDERPGVKFKDADLLGMPLRINIGARGIKANEIELVSRADKQTQKVPVEQLTAKVKEWLKSN